MAPSNTPLQWIRPPRQARTQQSLERLLDAAETLLRDKSFEDVHVSEIALRADTSVAAFYRRFRDKNALLYALHERFSDAAIATADEVLRDARWENAGIREILESIIPFLIEVLQSHEMLQRAVYRIALSDETMRERSLRLRRYVLGRLSELLLMRSSEIKHPDPNHAVPFALVQAGALMTEFYLTGMRDSTLLPSSDKKIAEEIVHSCCSYLFSDE
ncbi:MAG: helix-turn-helix domain-containing protein [Myxococcales bacterium]|jgi:AcrR family transcriptional regulator|nr:TetR/AcrR family transcriptional regulator [Myxococcales bacterium]